MISKKINKVSKRICIIFIIAAILGLTSCADNITGTEDEQQFSQVVNNGNGGNNKENSSGSFRGFRGSDGLCILSGSSSSGVVGGVASSHPDPSWSQSVRPALSGKSPFQRGHAK